MGSAPGSEAVTQPSRSDFLNAPIHGDGSLVIGLLALVSPFVTARYLRVLTPSMSSWSA